MLIDLFVFPQIHVPVEKLVTIEQTYHKTTLAKLQDKLPLVRKYFITLNFARSVAGLCCFRMVKMYLTHSRTFFPSIPPENRKPLFFCFHLVQNGNIFLKQVSRQASFQSYLTIFAKITSWNMCDRVLDMPLLSSAWVFKDEMSRQRSRLQLHVQN